MNNIVVRLCQYPPLRAGRRSATRCCARGPAFTHQAVLGGRDATVGGVASRLNASCTDRLQPPFPRNAIYTADWNPVVFGAFPAARPKQKYRPNSPACPPMDICQPRAPAPPDEQSRHAGISLPPWNLPNPGGYLCERDIYRDIYILVHPSHIYRQRP
ncbi:hypothetical protein VTN02DRAFT_6435 [Thermoascus thermophilus]